jgi:hypothetical protein
MLRKIAAAVVATALIAGPAFAAPPSSTAGATPATSSTMTKPAAKPTMTVKHVRKHRHLVRHKVVHKTRVARHLSKMHRRHFASHVVKPIKHGKPTKTTKTNKPTKSNTTIHG